ncbi:MFS transporter [Ornithinibacillus gellani]|uniref:MFS transporter n=1 Tax=Ornithinibacillus gellani TaxID=2293253 RepID=UPI000F47DC9C|nr:MFS transporter [Ornithinibacillus gellani]TQS74100.1 MFS transporter [Ornithinibacillus gellani]
MKHKQRVKPITPTETVYPILFIIGICHLLNDSLQAVIPAMFPILEEDLGLNFTQLGLIAFTLNMVASVMQPVIGMYTDKRPMPYALPLGLTSSMLGMLGLALAPNFLMIIASVFFIGLGSAIFHPEGSRVAFFAAGNRRGLAQSIYQVGGNTGQALAPLITALILVPLRQFGAIWFTLIAGLAVFFLMYISKWYAAQIREYSKRTASVLNRKPSKQVSRAIRNAIIILIFLVFARSWYMSAISNFYAFYVIDEYGFSIRQSQIYIFIFLGMGAAGTFFGGPLADRFGKRNIILFSLLGSAPLAILLPYVGPIVAIVLLASVGFILMSSFSVTVVYAQELVPGKIGTMSGLIVGLAFGMGAIGSVALGSMIDSFGLIPTMITISLLPLLGLLTFLLPTDEKVDTWYANE